MARLTETPYLAFPFRVGDAGAAACGRAEHVRQQIEQILFTQPGERVFRPEFGAGVRGLVFEPNSSPLWELTRKRLQAAVAEALAGEADPKSIEIAVEGEGEQLLITIRYALTRLGIAQTLNVRLGG